MPPASSVTSIRHREDAVAALEARRRRRPTDMPTARPTAAAVSALPTWWAPTTPSVTGALPSGVTRVNRARSRVVLRDVLAPG